MTGSLCFDTSVVMRLLVRDPEDQYRRASAYLKEQLTAGVSVLVPDLVLAEAYFALQAFYQLPKKDASRPSISSPGTAGSPLLP